VHWRSLISLIAAVLFVPLLVLGIIYAVSLKHDLVSVKNINNELLSYVRAQKDINTQQLAVNKQLLTATNQQLATSQQVLQLSQSMDSKLSTSLNIQQQLLGVSQATLGVGRATLQTAQDIDRKMPPSITPATVNGLVLP
jgi:hypothetical protein